MILICQTCGKVFKYKYKKKYCSHECRVVVTKIRTDANGQLCWRCAKACGGCSWSSSLTPVEGWEAEPHLIKDATGDINTYKIRKCPLFVKG